MSKIIRYVAAAVLIISVVLLAGNQLVSAGKGADQASSSVQSQSDLAPASAKGEPGTVKPPPVVVPPINEPGTYSAGGVCTVVVESISDPTSLHVNLLPFTTVWNRPKETDRYLAGVCQLVYVIKGKGVSDVTPADAVVKICFAAIPNETNTIYVFEWKTQTWFALDTTVENGLACAPATKTGRYVLVKMP